MKSLITFSASLTDPLRIRILALACEHKTSTAELVDVLKQPQQVIAAQVKQLQEAHLIKGDEKSDELRLKRKHAKLLDALFEQFKINVKKDPTLRNDAKALKQHRASKKAASKSKPAKKAATNVKEAKQTKSTKPKVKAK